MAPAQQLGGECQRKQHESGDGGCARSGAGKVTQSEFEVGHPWHSWGFGRSSMIIENH